MSLVVTSNATTTLWNSSRGILVAGQGAFSANGNITALKKGIAAAATVVKYSYVGITGGGSYAWRDAQSSTVSGMAF